MVREYKTIKCAAYVILMMVMFCMMSNNTVNAKSRVEIKVSCGDIYNNTAQHVYSEIHTTNLPWYKNVSWSISNTKIANIVYVNSYTRKTEYAKSVNLQAYNHCYISAKSPGTTWLTVRVNGYKGVKRKINIKEKGDAIGFYAKTGINRYRITKDEKRAAKILKKAVKKLDLKGESIVDKVRRIHDYVASITSYDFESHYSNTYRSYDGTASGPLIYNKAVCQGYAVTFDAFMYYLGIPAKLISGDNHAWNLVKMDDNKWYHIDVTWDDGDANTSNPDDKNIYYDYFLKDDVFLGKNHKWKKSMFPKCDGYTYLDYSDVINRQIIQAQYPTYNIFESKDEVISYLSDICRLGVTSAPVVYRSDSWLTDDDWNEIRYKSGRYVNYGWDNVGCVIGGYRLYDLILYY